MSIPENLKYTNSHEWLKIEGDVAIIGITDHAQAELGDIVYLELPEAGRVLQKEEVFGTVESVKAVSELYSPVSGEVIETNAPLCDATETINKDPYNTAWLVKVRVFNPAELDGLLDSNAYAKLIEE
jgi:glycine cleavage system H protein